MTVERQGLPDPSIRKPDKCPFCEDCKNYEPKNAEPLIPVGTLVVVKYSWALAIVIKQFGAGKDVVKIECCDGRTICVKRNAVKPVAVYPMKRDTYNDGNNAGFEWQRSTSPHTPETLKAMFGENND